MADVSPQLYVGVDGGPSSTVALAADAGGHVLGTGSAGPISPIIHPGGEDRLREAVSAAVRSALEAAEKTMADVAVIGLGLAGFNERLRSLSAGLFPDTPVVAAHESVTALFGAGGGGEGVVLIAGDSSMAYGRTKTGQEAQAGGWGHLASDEGSAYWIGLEGLKAAFRSWDGRTAPSPLQQLVPARFGVPDMPALRRALSGDSEDRALITSVARDVSDAAEEGDRVAQGILHHAALHLANAASAVHRRLWKPEEDVSVFYTGPVFGDRFLKSQFDDWMARLAPDLACQPPLAPPVVGALLLAYGAAGITPDELDWDALLHGLSEAPI